MEVRTERGFAAILSADMAGFSRLVERDEEGVIRRQKEYRYDFIDPEIASRRGRIVKTTGDGMLVEFASAQNAVRCAKEIQAAMADGESVIAPDDRIRYRVGINLGDIVFDEEDVFGDGVNVAARLQALAEPGGVCVSDIVHQTLTEAARGPFRDIGSQRVKNISRAIRVWQRTPEAAPASVELPDEALHQRVRFARAPDGVQIAWASMGAGAPVLKAPNFLNHIDYEWPPLLGPFPGRVRAPLPSRALDRLGNGLSDWEADEISVDSMISDMGTVAKAAELGRFALFGLSRRCAFSIRFAAEKPGRLTCLVLYGGYARGRLMRGDPRQRMLQETLGRVIEEGWGSPKPVFRHLFTSTFIPDAPPEIGASFDELQRMATSPQHALRIRDMNARVAVTVLARRLRVPTPVLHCQGDRVTSIDEARHMARLIPGATLVELPGNNHALLAGSPAVERFFGEVPAFLDAHNR